MTSLGKVIETADGSLSLIHPEHDECYHSHGGALWEAQSLYCQASGFKEQLEQQNKTIYVLDVGLGLSYNACSTLDAWFHSSGASSLVMHSLEVNPMLVAALSKNKGPWQANWPAHWQSWCSSLKATDKESVFSSQIKHPKNPDSSAQWTIHVGDALKTCQTLQQDLEAAWDFIWQDPFSPEKNPSMWNKEWFAILKANSNENTKLLTYSVARLVKNALMDAGWEYQKVKATGPKRHWLRASLLGTSPFQSR